VATNDGDVDGDKLTYTLTGAPLVGLVLNNDGTFTYNPAPDFNGTVSFDYEVSDGNGGKDAGKATITVTAVNDAPVAGDDTFTINEDTSLNDTVSTNDSDVDGDKLTCALVGPALAGLTFNSDGTFTYTPAADANGTVSFTYKASDGNGGSDNATVTINVTPVNDAPVAKDDSFSVNEDGSLSESVASNDSDVDGDKLTYTLTSGPLAGLVLNNDGTFTYNPAPDFNGTVSFDYEVSDGNGGTDAGTATIVVTPVNDAPVAVDEAFTTDEDTGFTDTVATNDSDVDGDTLTYSLLGGPVAGLTLNPDGTFTYTPPLNFSGPVTFNYQVSDGNGGTDTGTATITVNAVNDAPAVAVPASIIVAEDTPSDVTGIVFSDVDAGAGTVTVTLIVSGGTLAATTTAFVTVAGAGSNTVTLTGTLASINSFIAGGNVDFTTPLNSTADQVLTAKIDDGGNTGSGGSQTASDTVKITVTPVNDAPTDLALAGSSVDENDSSGPLIGTLTVTDPDAGDSHTLTVDDSRFEIVGNALRLKAGETLDFESESTVTVQVTAKDSGGLTYAESFVITVNDKTGSSIGGDAGDNDESGTDQDDTIFGFGGNDKLNGLGGGDSINGGDDNDNLDGGDGNDTLDGGSGDDSIVGGNGNDLIIWDPADSAIDGGAGTDTIFLNGSDFDLSAPISGIEVIDMTGFGSNTSKVTATDVLAVSDTDTILVIGDAGDTLDGGGGGWTFAGKDGGGNSTYTQDPGFGTATLVVDADVTFVNL
jgi:hypothetical protein